MHVAVVTPPAPFVTLGQAKAQLHIEHNEYDARILSYVAAATSYLDGPDKHLRRAVGRQVLRVTLYQFPHSRRPGCGLMLPCPTAIAINSVECANSAGQVVAIDPDIYELTADGRIQLAYGMTFPERRSSDDPISVTYVAGYEKTPPEIMTAALMHISAMYDEGAASAGFPKAAADLVDGAFRLPRL